MVITTRKLGSLAFVLSSAVLYLCTAPLAFSAQDEALTSLPNSTKVTAQTPSAENALTSRYEDGEELIFEVLLDKYTLGEAFAVAQNGDVLYDLSNLLELVDFPIEFDNASRTYNGWYIKEANNFSLAVLGNSDFQGQLVVNYSGKTLIVEQHQFTFIDDVFYISQTVIEQIFGLGFSYNLRKLQVRLLPAVTLPLLARLAREAKAINKSDSRTIKYANLPRSYELLSPQIFDFNLSSSFRESTQQFNTQYSLTGARDIALMHVNYSLVGNNKDPLTNGRLSFSRESLQGDLLGFLNATSVNLGDVRAIRQATGSTSQETLGMTVSNEPLSNALDNEVMTIDGDIPIGWDAQLLRNGILLDQQTSVQTGQYAFLDVPLIFGENNFSVILYGPQGQIQTRNIFKLVDRNILKFKGLKYAFSINDGDDTLLGLDTIDDATDVGYNFSGQFTQGLGSSVLANIGYQTQFGGDFNGSNVSGGLSAVVADKMLVNVNTSIDDKRNVSVASSLRTTLFDQSILLQYRFSDSFDNAVNSARSDSINLSLNGSLPLWGTTVLPYQNRLSYSDNGQVEIFTFNNKLSFYNRWFSIFHDYEYSQQQNSSAKTTNTRGSLSLQKSLGQVYLRYSSVYSLNDEFEFLNHAAQLNWTMAKNIRTKLSLSHSVVSQNNSADLQLGWFNDRFQLFGSVKHSDQAGLELGLNTRLSFAGQNSEYGNIHQQSRSLGGAGSIAVRVFDDENMNAIFDEGENVLPGVTVEAVQVHKKGVTDDNGIAMITGVSSFTTSDIKVDQSSMPDPFYVPLVEGVSITFRKGLIDTLDFPMAMGSDIEGLINIFDGISIKQSRNVIVELRDTRGRLIKTTKTEFDGFYVFAGVLPGNYRISIAPESIEAFEVLATESHSLSVTRDTEILSDQNFTLTVQGYKSGFITELGVFENERLVNIYQLLLKQKLSTDNTSFFTFPLPTGNTQQYILSSFYTFDEEQAKQQCTQISAAGIMCKVRAVELPVDS